MTDLMTYPHTKSHISQESQVFLSLLTTWCDPQRSVSPWSAWRPERSRWRWVCRRRQRSGRRLFLNSDREISQRAAQGHSAQNTSRNTSFDHGTLHRHRRHHRDRQHVVKPCYFVTHPDPKISSPLNLKMGHGVPKSLISSPLVHFFLTTVPQMVENTVQK